MSKESRHRNRVQEEKRARSDRYIRNYQKLCFYCILPGLLDFFSCVLGLFSKTGIQVAFRMGVTRLFYDLFDSMSMPALSLLTSGVIAGAFVALAIFSAKGKTACCFTLAGIYLADCLFLPFYLTIINPPATMNVEEVLAIVIHLLFLSLSILMVVFYFKATKSLQDERR